VIKQFRDLEGERVQFSERVALQELQVSLLTPLPLRDSFEIVDIPADEFGHRRCAMLNTNERGRVLQGTSRCFAQVRAAER